jgi:hypothetical protein
MEPEVLLPHIRDSDLSVHVGVKIGLSHSRKSVGCGCWKVGADEDIWA